MWSTDRSPGESGRVDVWKVPLSDPRLHDEASLAVLDDQEADRARRLRLAIRRRRFAASHAALRYVLASYVGIHPADLRFDRRCRWCGNEKHGKPRLEDCEIQFGLAHSSDIALIAIADCAVAVDIELLRSEMNLSGLVRWACTPRESASLRASPPELRTERFLRLWTAKEAFAKGVGLGLMTRFNGIDVGLTNQAVHGLTHPDVPGRWTVNSLELGPDYVGAVAAAADSCQVHLRAFEPEATMSVVGGPGPVQSEYL
jgi:4'-phosphopantetheinyl transferase